MYLFEAARWRSRERCPHCGSQGNTYILTPRSDSTHGVPAGVRKCGACRRKYTVILGTIFEGSHIPLRKWLAAIHLVCTKEDGVSALELQRELDLKSYRSALFAARKIRWAMSQPPLARLAGKPARKLRLKIDPGEALTLLLAVKPAAGMPRPGANRRKSVWAEVEEEYS